MQLCDLTWLLLPYELRKSENVAYATSASANGVRLLVVVQNHVVENKITKASSYTRG